MKRHVVVVTTEPTRLLSRLVLANLALVDPLRAPAVVFQTLVKCEKSSLGVLP